MTNDYDTFLLLINVRTVALCTLLSKRKLDFSAIVACIIKIAFDK